MTKNKDEVVKVTSLTVDDRDSILRMVPWDVKLDSPLGELLLATARGEKPSMWTLASLVEKLQKRDQEIINKTEVYLDERHNFMVAEDEEKEAVNF